MLIKKLQTLKKIKQFVITNFNWRNLFCLNSLLKLVFLYSVVIICIIISNFDFSNQFWQHLFKNERNHYRIAFYTTDRIGEKMLYNRLKTVANKNEWDYVGAIFPESVCSYFLTKHFYLAAANFINLLFKPRFNLSVTHYVNILPYGYNITYLNMPMYYLIDIDDNFHEKYHHLSKYDGYVDLISFAQESDGWLRKALKNYNKENALIIPAYLSQNILPYKPFNERKQALITGTLWGCNRSSLRFAKALKHLAQEDLIIAYGGKEYKDLLKENYKGTIDKNIKGMERFHNIQQQAGIALLIHSLEHFAEKLPTSRISEAVNASSIVITEEHPFIKKYFGNSVLYYNSFGTYPEIYKQIKNHLNWIKMHPAETEEKTKKAYDIFINNFTLEQQLKTIVQKVEEDLKKRGL